MKLDSSQSLSFPLNRNYSPALPKSGFARKLASLAVTASLLATSAVQATQTAILTTHHSFDGTVSTDAAGPVKGLVLASDGNYYGCARSGAAGYDSYRGSIFKVTPDGTYSILCNFDGTTHGATPFGTLSEGSDNQLYGVTVNSSVANNGTVFKVNFSGTITTLFTFTNANNNNVTLGMQPDGVLIGSDGDLYVSCRSGGSNNVGSIVKMHADGSSPTRLATFTGGNGSGPVGRLVEAADGSFWGATENGGTASCGTVFKLTPAGVLTTVVSFDGTHHRYPKSGLIKGSDGNLYGTTYGGGTGNRGIVYKMTTGGTLTVLTEMAVATGTNPGGALAEGPDHSFYGLAYAGGSAGYGTIYRVTAGGTLTALLSFQNTSAPRGAASMGDLIFGADNHLWGMTTLGGAYISGGTAGTVFSADIGLTSPDLAVEAPAGTALAYGASINYGSLPNRTSQTKTFTLKNNGYSALELTSASVTGANAADFAVDTTGMASSLEPGGETTFTVTLTPTATGPRSATLQILSNDPGHSTFSLNLTGTAVASSIFAFGAPTYTVVQGATSVSLTVTRAITTPAQTVQIGTTDGTDNAFPPYSPALAGVDYNAPTGAATTLSFAVGQSAKTVVLTLRAKTGTQPNKRFTAALSSPSEGGTLGAITSTTIQILAADAVKPNLVVTSPVASSVLAAAETPTIDVDGTAGDARGVSKVTVTANGASVAVTLGEPSGTAVPFTASFMPVLGSNTVTVSAYDLRNNVTTITRTFTLTGGVPLSVVRSIPVAAGTKYDSVGTVAAVATPVRSANGFTPTTPNANPKTCLVIPGAPIRLTATANLGYAFSHWSNLPGDAQAVGNVVTFAMPSDATSVTAVFVVSAFSGVGNNSTAFYGLLHPTAGAAASVNTEGYLFCSLTNNGAFTGSISIDGLTQSLAGSFFGDGSSSFTAGGVLYSTLTFGGRTLTLSYNASSGRDQITATTAKDGVTSTGAAKRAYYSPTRKVPSTLLNQVSKSLLTFVISSKDQTPSVDKTTYPQGDDSAPSPSLTTVPLPWPALLPTARLSAPLPRWWTVKAALSSCSSPHLLHRQSWAY